MWLHGGLGGGDRDDDGPDPGVGGSPGRRRARAQLGLAFQLTNFIRDLAEDAAGGRVYLPAEDLEHLGCAARIWPAPRPPRRWSSWSPSRWGARAHYAAAEPGIDLLAPSSQPCVRVAFDLYAGILEEVEGPATRSWTAASGSP